MSESPVESSQWPCLLPCPQVSRLSHLQRHRGLCPHPELLPSRDPQPQQGQGEEGRGKVQSFSTHRSSPCRSSSPGSCHDASAEAPAVQGVLQVTLSSLLSSLTCPALGPSVWNTWQRSTGSRHGGTGPGFSTSSRPRHPTSGPSSLLSLTRTRAPVSGICWPS